MRYQGGALRRDDIEVVIDRRSVYFGVELDNDHLPAPYEHGAWNELLGEVLVEFASKNSQSNPFTIWTGMLPSTNFFHPISGAIAGSTSFIDHEPRIFGWW